MIEIDGIVLEDTERQPCEIWSRAMGYHRPVSEFNIGKKAEFRERVNFSIEKTMSQLNPLNTSESE